MKNLILLFTLITTSLFAQTGINYQGAATNSDGAKLANQNISLRTSVLQGGVDGTTSYSETHNTTTDQFGLFNMVIGQGEVISGVFDDITWGADAHFLKVELDATGGTNYSLVSTTQMMGVPYALYAKNAGLDSAAVADMLSNMNISVNSGGYDLNFPDGLDGEMIAWDLSNGNNYTVPTGKNLFITNVHTRMGGDFRIDGLRVLENYWGLRDGSVNMEVGMLKNPLCIKSGQVISAYNHNDYEESFYGILTNAIVEPISYEFDNSGSGYESYTVPDGKKLVITNLWISSHVNKELRIDGVIFSGNTFNKPNMQDINKILDIPIIIESGSTISLASDYSSFNGYLADQDYFSGHSSSSSSNSGGGANTMDLSVSQFGDTLFGLGNDFLIIPGISEANHNIQEYGTVTDIDGNTYNTLVYGDNEWMIENLRTNIGDYTEVSAGSFDEYTENVGNYYSGNTLTDVCPTGWHVATMQDWQDFHFDIFGSEMYDNGFTNSENEILDFDGEILWSNEFGGSNQSGFNLFNTGWYVINNGNIHDSENSTSFWVDEECDILGEKKVVNIFSSGLNQYLIHVSCSNPSDAKFQIRCVKEQEDDEH